jgi:hypothetical protein
VRLSISDRKSRSQESGLNAKDTLKRRFEYCLSSVKNDGDFNHLERGEDMKDFLKNFNLFSKVRFRNSFVHVKAIFTLRHFHPYRRDTQDISHVTRASSGQW